jgi:hypothetical protein
MSDWGSWGGQPGAGGPGGPNNPGGGPPPPQPQWGQPPPSGQPPYGQPPYGQQPYGQPQPGPQHFGQPGWGPPPTGGGKGPLVAGLVVAALAIAAVVGGVIVLSGSDDEDGEGEQTITTLSGSTTTTAAPTDPQVTTTLPAGGDVTVFDLSEGDCWDEPAQTDVVSEASVVPCETPHDLEVYAVYQVDFADFPGEDAMGDSVEGGCVERFAEFVGLDYPNSSLDVLSLFPTQESWDVGDREATCSIGDPAAQTTGSLRGAAR